MDWRSDLLKLGFEWLGTRGLVARRTDHIAALLGVDEMRRQLSLSFAAALFVIGFVPPGVSELLSLRPEGSSMVLVLLFSPRRRARERDGGARRNCRESE